MDPLTAAGPAGAPGSAPTTAAGPAWDRLARLALRHAAGLSAPPPGAPGLCRTCFGPAAAGRVRCFPCELHGRCAPGALASVVLRPPTPSRTARTPGRCGSTSRASRARRPPAGPSPSCSWCSCASTGRACGTGRGGPGPTHVAVVPSTGAGPACIRCGSWPGPTCGCRGQPWRPGPAPTSRAGTSTRSGSPAPAWPGARVLLIDDTWATGASAQSAAMALRQAGARSVVTVVLGLVTARPRTRPAPARPATPFLPGCCAVHAAPAVGARP